MYSTTLFTASPICVSVNIDIDSSLFQRNTNLTQNIDPINIVTQQPLEQSYSRAEQAAVSGFDLVSDTLTKLKTLDSEMTQVKTWLNEQQPVASQPVTLQCPLQDMQKQAFQHKVNGANTLDHFLDY